jgi:hypothetical protein
MRCASPVVESTAHHSPPPPSPPATSEAPPRHRRRRHRRPHPPLSRLPLSPSRPCALCALIGLLTFLLFFMVGSSRNILNAGFASAASITWKFFFGGGCENLRGWRRQRVLQRTHRDTRERERVKTRVTPEQRAASVLQPPQHTQLGINFLLFSSPLSATTSVLPLYLSRCMCAVQPLWVPCVHYSPP